MNRAQIIVFITILLFLLFLFFSPIIQNTLARLAWHQYNNAYWAYILNRSDTNLAIQIGNYYFNGTVGKSEYDLEKAEKSYSKALAASPDILWGHYQLGRIYFIRGDFNKALEEINKELKARPENLRPLYMRGLIFGYQGNLKEAEDNFRRFAEWSPLEWAGYNDLAWILAKEGKYGEAEKTIQSAFDKVKDASKNPWLWNALGVAELNLKKYAMAADSFKKAKASAQKLTPEEWHKTYPGNNPADSSEGLSAFLSAIEKNLEKATQK